MIKRSIFNEAPINSKRLFAFRSMANLQKAFQKAELMDYPHARRANSDGSTNVNDNILSLFKNEKVDVGETKGMSC